MHSVGGGRSTSTAHALTAADQAWRPDSEPAAGPSPTGRAPSIREATTDFAYLRLLGRRDVFPDFGRVHRPQDEALEEWAGFLKSLPSQVRRAFVFVNNQFEGHSPATIARLRGLLPGAEAR